MEKSIQELFEAAKVLNELDWVTEANYRVTEFQSGKSFSEPEQATAYLRAYLPNAEQAVKAPQPWASDGSISFPRKDGSCLIFGLERY